MVDIAFIITDVAFVMGVLLALAIGIALIWAVGGAIFDGAQRRAYDNRKKWDNK